MRCCLESLYEWIEEHSDEPAVAGTIVECKYEPQPNERMILGEDMVWRWNERERD